MLKFLIFGLHPHPLVQNLRREALRCGSLPLGLVALGVGFLFTVCLPLLSTTFISFFKWRTIIQGDWLVHIQEYVYRFQHQYLRHLHFFLLIFSYILSATMNFLLVSWCTCKNLARGLQLKVGPQTIWVSPGGLLELQIYGPSFQGNWFKSAFNEIPRWFMFIIRWTALGHETRSGNSSPKGRG